MGAEIFIFGESAIGNIYFLLKAQLEVGLNQYHLALTTNLLLVLVAIQKFEFGTFRVVGVLPPF
jgi:hypothetical protein